MKERNLSIDVLKGIGIILVLVAHSLEGWVSQFAYSFHMPLFFITTGLFISEVKDSNYTDYLGTAVTKDFKRLVVPALFTTITILVISYLFFVCPNGYFSNPINLIWNTSADKQYALINSLGNLWFLFALFWSKFFFYLIRQFSSSSVFPVFSLLCGYVAIFIGHFFLLPFEMLVGLSVVPFVWVGYYIKQKGGLEYFIQPCTYFVIPVWIMYIFFGHLRVDLMEYKWFLVFDIVAACGGVLTFYKFSEFIVKHFHYPSKMLAFLGTYSLILICAPTIETYCCPMQEIIPVTVPFRFVFVILGKVLWCALCMYACLNIQFLSRIFGVKK